MYHDTSLDVSESVRLSPITLSTVSLSAFLADAIVTVRIVDAFIELTFVFPLSASRACLFSWYSHVVVLVLVSDFQFAFHELGVSM
jgi:hypothetical protein